MPGALAAILTCVFASLTLATGAVAAPSSAAACTGAKAKRPPRGLTITGRTSRSIALDWKRYRGRRHFKVYVYAADGSTRVRTERTGRGSARTVRRLRPGTRYVFRVAAVCRRRARPSRKSRPVSGTTESDRAAAGPAPSTAPAAGSSPVAAPAPATRFPGHFFFATDRFITWNPEVDAPRIDFFLANAHQTDHAAAYKRYNPDGTALFYDDFGVAGDPCCYATVLSSAEVQANGWWATRSGARIANPWGGDSWLVDLGKPGVKEAYVRALTAEMAAGADWDGVLADDVNAWRNAWPIDGYSSPEDWVERAVDPLMAHVRDNFRGLVVPNLGNWPQEPVLDSTARLTHGGMSEWFGMWNGGAQSPSEIENTFRSVRDAMTDGRSFFGVAHTATRTKYTFCLAAILGEPGRILVTNQTGYGSPGTWDPVFETELGAPTGPAAHSTGSPRWSRSFAGGHTLTVDTTALTCSGI